MTKFKVGAFSNNCSVLPLYFEFTNRFCDCYSQAAGYYHPGSPYHLMSQFINFVSVHYMDVYHPNDNELKKPPLYAFNVS